MSDIINELPRELLCQVFDLLPFKDQLKATSTCANWNLILSDNRFMVRKRIRLIPYVNLGGDLDDLQLYRSFTVAMKNTTQHVAMYGPETLPAVSSFLRRDDVADRVEELRLERFHHQLPMLFGTSPLYLPRLEKLWLNVDHQEVENVVAPALRHVEMSNMGIDRPARFRVPFVGHVEKLGFNLMCRGGTSPRRCLGESYEHLRRLEIKGFMMFSQFDCEFMRLLVGQLTHLKLHFPISDATLLTPLLETVLPKATNLQVLDVRAEHVDLDLSMLEPLKQLRELRLPDCISLLENPYRATMPGLIKLTTPPSVAPLVIAKNLRSLTIINRGSIGRCSGLDFRNYPQLSSLRLANVSLDTFCVDHLSATRVQTMELQRVFVARSDLERAMGVLTANRQLHRAFFEDCRIIPEDGSKPSSQDSAYYKKLSRMFPTCSIAVKYSWYWLLEEWEYFRYRKVVW